MDIGMTLLGQALTFALLIAFTAKFLSLIHISDPRDA